MADLVLVDLGAEFWRNWYATHSGVSAFELTVERVQFYSENADRCIVCADRPPFRRAKRFPEYKAQREAKPEDAIDSLIAAEQQCEAFCEVMGAAGYEADDVIATLALDALGLDVAIVSQDKDLYQLISPTCRLVRKDGMLVDAEGCRLKFGVLPHQMHDWLTMVGDTADNIPGCPKLGPGRARDLLVRFETLDAVIAATDDELLSVRGIGAGTVASLREWDPSLARELTRLETTAPVSL